MEHYGFPGFLEKFVTNSRNEQCSETSFNYKCFRFSLYSYELRYENSSSTVNLHFIWGISYNILALYREQGAVKSIAADCENNSTIFFSMWKMPHSRRLIKVIPSNASTARFSTTSNHVRTCTSPIWTIWGATATTDIVCFVPVQSLGVNSFWICFFHCSHRYRSLTQLRPSPCLTDMFFGAWHNLLLHLICVLYAPVSRRTPLCKAIPLKLGLSFHRLTRVSLS